MEKEIKDYSAPSCALFLMTQHSINGTFRDEGDLDNSKYHSIETITFMEDILKNTKGSIEEKLVFLEKVKSEIPKFHGK